MAEGVPVAEVGVRHGAQDLALGCGPRPPGKGRQVGAARLEVVPGSGAGAVMTALGGSPPAPGATVVAAPCRATSHPSAVSWA